jgi:hypothetical protein
MSPGYLLCDRESVEETYSVCKWFDVNGVMSKDNIKSDVLKVLRAYESGDSEPKKRK